ncbi:MAG: ChaN family lipoprotein [Desulfurococcales archaeon]|nr:ChaN family lipoprotein [Desulfurococcales archaeon]
MSCNMYKIGSWERVELGEVLSCIRGDGWIIYVGEVHERGWIVNCIRSLVNALRDRIGFIGMEHFNYTQQPLLDSWLRGSIGWGELVEEYRSGDEGFNLTIYKPLLEDARSLGIPVVGLMPPRRHASLIAHKGLEALYQEAEPPVDPGEVLREYRGYADRFLSLIPRQGPMARLDPRRLLLAQAYKDTVMAYNALKALKRYGNGVVVTGWAHVEHNGTVPTRAKALDPGHRYMVLTSRESGLNDASRELEGVREVLLASYLLLPPTPVH